MRPIVATGDAASPAAVDDATIARFRGGDDDAFLAVHDVCAPAIRALVGRFFSSAFEREEAAQEIWLQAHRMASTYEPARGPLLPWLRALASNRCKELLRARGRRPDPREELDESATADGGGAENPEAAARQARLRAAVARFSSELTEEEATVLRLSLLEERSHDEVAALTGQSARRCKYLRGKLLARAAAHPELRAALQEVVEP